MKLLRHWLRYHVNDHMLLRFLQRLRSRRLGNLKIGCSTAYCRETAVLLIYLTGFTRKVMQNVVLAAGFLDGG